MIDQQEKLNGSAEAFVRAFSDLIKDSTSHLASKDDLANMAANMATKDDIANMATKDDIANMATKDDIANMATKDDIANMATKDDIAELSDRIGKVEETVSEGYKRIYSWKDEMYNTFPRKDELKPSAFK